MMGQAMAAENDRRLPAGRPDFWSARGKTMNMAINRPVDRSCKKGDCELTGTKCHRSGMSARFKMT
jgi:hypothetical protein